MLTETTRSFFARDSLVVAPELLGCVLAHGGVSIEITEVEAYAGERDPGSHSYRGRTARNATLFGEAGHLYVYFNYGLHHAINLACGEVGQPYGCLIRSGRVIEGVDIARNRRGTSADDNLARGPGNLAQAFGATLENNGDDLFGSEWQFLVPGEPAPFVTGPRVGLSKAADLPWRFWIPGDPTVSAYRRAAARVPRPR